LHETPAGACSEVQTIQIVVQQTGKRNQTFFLAVMIITYTYSETGKVKWKYESDNYINGSACFNSKYFGGCDGFLHVVDLKTGAGCQIGLQPMLRILPYDGNDAYIGDYDDASRVTLKTKDRLGLGE
jgi:hypothetical protein